ncbi:MULTISPECIES: LysR substrate-binding domain-containing protein [unclassified Streptomyces]|uniref:LysR substrate-binding domain-containing protein n=1 Tax=unclassified Streptomyces TaxID=2593676 RepID=UPI00331B1A18
MGSAEHAADQFLPRLTAAVQERWPGCRVRFRVDRLARLVEAVERDSVDVAVYVTEAAATEDTPVGGPHSPGTRPSAGSHRPRPRSSRWSPSRTPARSATAPSSPLPRMAYPPRSSGARAISPGS